MPKKRLVVALIAVVIVGIFVVKLTKHLPTPAKSGSPTVSHNAPSSVTNSQPSFNKSAYSTTDPTSIWIVVNKQHQLNPKTYAPPDLTAVGNGQYLRAAAAQALSQMITDAKAAGYILTSDSGYRSYDTQVAVYNNEVKAYGQAVADSESARPGYSEHQTGWAIDLGSSGCNIQDCFATTAGGKWATANAYRYGFILRYPQNLTATTGYRPEAWHFRYVGPDLATELHQQNIPTLEEFFNISGGTTYK